MKLLIGWIYAKSMLFNNNIAMRNLWCLEKISILPFIISATGIVPQSLFKNLKILELENTLVVEIQKGILLYLLMSYREEIP
jgi:hypothetical protein